MKKILLSLYITFFFYNNYSFSQVDFRSNIACNYYGDSRQVSNFYGRVPYDAQANFVVEKIMIQIGLPANFKVIAGDVPNAAAVCILNKYNGNLERFIIYNSSFMAAVTENLNDWAAISIIAHEIGHHLSGHSLELGGSRPRLELEADRFSGFILKRMGANLLQAQLALNALTTEVESTTHPPKSQRLQAVKDGWNSTNYGIIETSSLNNSVAIRANNLSNTLSTSETKKIQIKLAPLKNCWVYLGSYFGKGMRLADSTYLDEKGIGVFSGKKLTGGIYFVVSPNYTIQFELLMDEKQQFSISADTAQKQNTIITGSIENDIFKQYTLYSAEKGKEIQQLKSQYRAKINNLADSLRLKNAIIQLENDIKVYRNNIAQKYPKSLLAMLLNSMKIPTVPAIPIVNGKPDSLYPYRYVKDHYWDDVSFNDDRLLRTPFFESKLDDYFKYYTSTEPDSLINEIKYMLLLSRTGNELYPYLLNKFINKYMNPELMGQDKVFLYLYQNFVYQGDSILFDNKARKAISDRAYSIMANQIGEKAPNIKLTTIDGKNSSLYDLNAPYTLVLFLDPNSNFCKKIIPELSAYINTKWKKYGVKVFSVNIYESELPEWEKIINEFNITEWVNVYETSRIKNYNEKNGVPNYRQLFDVFKVPMIYLLDRNKKILAKNISLPQIDIMLSKF